MVDRAAFWKENCHKLFQSPITAPITSNQPLKIPGRTVASVPVPIRIITVLATHYNINSTFSLLVIWSTVDITHWAGNKIWSSPYRLPVCPIKNWFVRKHVCRENTIHRMDGTRVALYNLTISSDMQDLSHLCLRFEETLDDACHRTHMRFIAIQ